MHWCYGDLSSLPTPVPEFLQEVVKSLTHPLNVGQKKRNSSWTMSLFWQLPGNTSIPMRCPNLKVEGGDRSVIEALDCPRAQQQGCLPLELAWAPAHPRAWPSTLTLSSRLLSGLPSHTQTKRAGWGKEISDQAALSWGREVKGRNRHWTQKKYTQSNLKPFSPSQLVYIFPSLELTCLLNSNLAAGHSSCLVTTLLKKSFKKTTTKPPFPQSS